MDVHIQDKQRKLILEKGGINSQVNKYLQQMQISAEKGSAELEKLLDKLEELIGYKLNDEERVEAIAGKLTSLKETLQELDIKGTTVFFWDKEKNLPCIGDHMISGFLKAAAEAVGRTLPKKNGTILHSIGFTQSIINQHLRCGKQFLTFNSDIMKDDTGRPSYLQRSLRAMTLKGPRISLARSERVPAGTKLAFDFKVMNNSPLTKDALNTLFDYGSMVGIGQWRSAGFGSFTYTLQG
jgi:hypothetical protein